MRRSRCVVGAPYNGYVPLAAQRTFAGAEVFALGHSLTGRRGRADCLWRRPVGRASSDRKCDGKDGDQDAHAAMTQQEPARFQGKVSLSARAVPGEGR